MTRAVRRFLQSGPRKLLFVLFVLTPLAARPARAQALFADVPAIMVQQVLEAHNGERCFVSPAAKGMPALQWDVALAEVARTYAATCPTGHNANRSSDYAALGGSGYVGENLVFATPGSSMVRMMRALAREKYDYTYQRHPSGPSLVGHYTQMIWAGTTHVGCGQAICGNQKILVCNYSPGGNIIGRFPYLPAGPEPVTTGACAAAGRRHPALDARAASSFSRTP